jgi:F-type H+-transporting ATPase subunit delta
MKITPKQYAKSLFELIDSEKDEKINQKIIERFIKMLIRNNQVSQFEKILSYFNNYWNSKNKIVQAEIQSNYNLNDDIIKLIKKYIKNKTNKDNINIENKINKELIGGFIIKYEDKIFDNSLRSKIIKLKNNII